MRARVLVVDDDVRSCEMLDEGLRLRGFDVVWATSVAEAITVLARESVDAVLTDLRMPHKSGLDLLEHVLEIDRDLPVIVVTAFGSIDAAVRAIRMGAYDFITKPFDLTVIELALERATRHRSMALELERLREASRMTPEFSDLVGSSPLMRRVFETLSRVAELDSTVLITGESGTGKELAARALHARSRRREGPFVAVNCAALPETLLESELFGHTKGAFSDARADRTGLIARASGGTLLLDEIGDMSPTTQAKLLRAIQERTIRPVGSDREIPIDVRIVAATHQDLEALVTSGRFRQDLWFRINVIEVAMPPLRMRGSDVLELAERFLERFSAQAERSRLHLSSSAAQRLLAYDWPGNVRELSNAMERAVALARENEVTLADLPTRIAEAGTRDTVLDVGDPSEMVSLDEMERRYIRRVLEATGGNKKLAAQVLGLDRSTLYRKLGRERATDGST